MDYTYYPTTSIHYLIDYAYYLTAGVYYLNA